MSFSNAKVSFSKVVKNMTEFYETTYDMRSKQNADLEGILFGQEDCAPGHAYGPTLRSYHLFHFVTKGKGTLQIDGNVFRLGAGDIFLIPAEQVSFYQASASDPWSYSWAGLTGIRGGRYVQQILASLPERYVARGLDTERYAAAIRRVAGLEGTSAENYFRTEAVLYELFSYLASDLPELVRTDRVPSLAARVRFYLDAKYTEDLQIHDVAEYFHVHPNHLSQIFRKEFGVPPKRYLMDRKLERSARMLKETDLPVSLIASSLGFEDQHAFSKTFKKFRGCSPMEYRKGAGDGPDL